MTDLFCTGNKEHYTQDLWRESASSIYEWRQNTDVISFYTLILNIEVKKKQHKMMRVENMPR